MAMNGSTRNTHIKSLPYATLLELTKRLDVNDNWMEVIGHICDKKGQPRYSDLEVRLFEREVRAGRSPSNSLLRDWGTSNATLDDLLQVLCVAELNDVAEYLLVSVLQEQARDDHQGSVNGQGGSSGKDSSSSSSCSVRMVHQESGVKLDVNAAPPHIEVHDTAADHTDDSFMDYQMLRIMCKNFDDRPISEGGRLLGRGGFGRVFLGITRSGEKKYAVKQLSCGGDAQQTAAQFEQELTVLSACQHCNLLALLGFVRGAGSNCSCIVYEYMENGSLEDRLSCKGSTAPLTATQRSQIGAGAAAGIAYLHAFRSPSPVVHRDIKSANILLDAQFIPKVGDFGLAKLIPAGVTNVFTSTVIGTACYMPPESLDFKVTTKWDTYSFGIVLLELLTGLPVMDSNREELALYRHVMENVTDDITPLADHKATWNPELANIIFKIATQCLAKDYHNRPEMMQVQQWLEDLERFYRRPSHARIAVNPNE